MIVSWLLFVGSAWSAVWDEPYRVNHDLGVSLVVALGPHADRKRFGVGIDASTHRYWHSTPRRSDVKNHPAPLASVAAHLVWNAPFVDTSVTTAFGLMHPFVVADIGFVSGIGVQGQAGLVMSSDGSAGPLLGGMVGLPLWETRLEATRWQGAWHNPRVATGPQLPLTCCGTYD